MTSYRWADAMNEIREDLILDALPPSWKGGAVRLPRPRHNPGRFFENGWVIAALCVLVSGVVLGGVIWLGRQKPPVTVPPAGTDTATKESETGPETPAEGLHFTSNGDGTCKLSTAVVHTPSDIVVPELSPAGDRVTAIGASAFRQCDMIRAVTLPDSVTSIGAYAFAYCPNLTTVRLGNGLKTIGSLAFTESHMEELVIPPSLTQIGANAFENTPIDRLVIQDFKAWFDINFNSSDQANPMNRASAIYIDGNPVEHMVIPEGVTTIQPETLQTCAGVKSLTLPDSLTTLTKYNFAMQDLTDITIGSGVREIYNSALSACPSLMRLHITDLAAWATMYDTGDKQGGLQVPELAYYVDGVLVEDLVIPAGVTFIQDGVFYEWNTLRSVTIPEGVTSVGAWAFGYCKNLESITFPDSMTLLCSRALSNCKSLKSVTLPTQLEAVTSDVFRECTGLETVFIPAGVTRIENGAFAHCKSLKVVEYGGTMEQWNALMKTSYWDEYTPYFTVRCTDGDIKAGSGNYMN